MTSKKPTIQQTVIVEGKTDTAKLQKLFDVKTIETGGFALSTAKLNLIKQAQAVNGIILCLDPDGPGEQLRKKILDALKQPCEQVCLTKHDMQPGSKKIGIAEAQDNALIKAFTQLVTFQPLIADTISWDAYCQLNLHSQQTRNYITDHYHIMHCNHKRLFKCLNMLQVTTQEITKLLDDYFAAAVKK